MSSLAAHLSSLGVGAGDRVVIYMPMIPEALVAMLATARLGAVHCVVFGGMLVAADNRMRNNNELLQFTYQDFLLWNFLSAFAMSNPRRSSPPAAGSNRTGSLSRIICCYIIRARDTLLS